MSWYLVGFLGFSTVYLAFRLWDVCQDVDKYRRWYNAEVTSKEMACMNVRALNKENTVFRKTVKDLNDKVLAQKELIVSLQGILTDIKKRMDCDLD